MDYGVGNHASVLRCVRQLGFRARVSNTTEQLDQADVLLLPGVGAFPTAMERLHVLDLSNYLLRSAQLNRPLIGICLGMQLLTESSTEMGFTSGLGLIPGSVEAIENPRWHIGWNGLEVAQGHQLLQASDREVMYFNHSYVYKGPDEFVAAHCRMNEASPPFVAAIARGSVIGLQFHPEKSQAPGLNLLARLIEGTEV
ncbi:imidazole glycerol phosphate synthase subunit HisH [bacterium]|nr:imidazole glycerol phosphate synthase subunit HisH [bacterium]